MSFLTEFELEKPKVICFTSKYIDSLIYRLTPEHKVAYRIIGIFKTISGNSIEFVSKHLSNIDNLYVNSYMTLDIKNYMMEYSIEGSGINNIVNNYRNRISTSIDNLLLDQFAASTAERKLVNDLFIELFKTIVNGVYIEDHLVYNFKTVLSNGEYLYIYEPKKYHI